MTMHDIPLAAYRSRQRPMVPEPVGKAPVREPFGGFPVFCRPVVDIATGNVAAVSAGPAWSEIAGAVRHPVCSLLSPVLYPGARGVVARKGLPLSVVESVCREFLRTSPCGEAPGFLMAAVGVPRGVPRVAAQIVDVICGLQLEPSRLALVFDCDDVLEDPLAALHAFLDLKRHGFKLGVDFADIEHLPYRILEMLPADYLRVRHEADPGLSRKAASGGGFAQRLRNVCAFAENLLMDVVVAGVDSVTKYDLLSDLGCRFGQGAYFPAVSPSGKSMGLFDTNGPPPGL